MRIMRYSDTYYSNIRWDLIDLIPEGEHRILEIGCGDGSTLIKLKEIKKACEIDGIEKNDALAEALRSRLDRAYIGDVEHLEAEFKERHFDYIIFGDVLEHLREPGKVLRRYSRYLKEDGYILASIPNIKYYDILLKLILHDRFEYQEYGILDRTHVKFYTRTEIMHLFDGEKLAITELSPKVIEPVRSLDKHYRRIFKRRVPLYSFFTIQYIVKAKKMLNSS